MATAIERIEYSLASIFTNWSYVRNEAIASNYDNHDVYTKSLIIDTSKDTYELPTIGCKSFFQLIQDTVSRGESLDKIVFNLIKPGLDFCYNFRSEARTVRELFANTFGYLRKYSYKEDPCFYAGSGAIFDSDFNPLVLPTINFSIFNDENNKVQTVLNKHIVRIHPRIFNNTDKVSKWIVKYVIPYYANKELKEWKEAGLKIHRIEIIISDFDYMFDSPIAPNPNITNEELNQVLIDNIGDVEDAGE